MMEAAAIFSTPANAAARWEEARLNFGSANSCIFIQLILFHCGERIVRLITPSRAHRHSLSTFLPPRCVRPDERCASCKNTSIHASLPASPHSAQNTQRLLVSHGVLGDDRYPVAFEHGFQQPAARDTSTRLRSQMSGSAIVHMKIDVDIIGSTRKLSSLANYPPDPLEKQNG